MVKMYRDIVTGSCVFSPLVSTTTFFFHENKSPATTVLKYLLIFRPGIAGVAYWTTGFAFAFGPGNNFIGWTYFALSYHPDNELAHVFLELVIAATCSTVVSGAVAGRCRMIAYIIYSFIITGNFLTLDSVVGLESGCVFTHKGRPPLRRTSKYTLSGA